MNDKIPVALQPVPVYATHEALPSTEKVPGSPYEYVLRLSYDRLYAHRVGLEREIEEIAAQLKAAMEAAVALAEAISAAEVVIVDLRAKLAEVQPTREELAESRDHLTVSGAFRSDKYPWCRVGFVPLKLADPAARDLLSEYARRRGVIDSAFKFDLYEALDRTPAKPNVRYEPFETVQELRAQLAAADDIALGNYLQGMKRAFSLGVECCEFGGADEAAVALRKFADVSIADFEKVQEVKS